MYITMYMPKETRKLIILENYKFTENNYISFVQPPFHIISQSIKNRVIKKPLDSNFKLITITERLKVNSNMAEA